MSHDVRVLTHLVTLERQKGLRNGKERATQHFIKAELVGIKESLEKEQGIE